MQDQLSSQGPARTSWSLLWPLGAGAVEVRGPGGMDSEGLPREGRPRGATGSGPPEGWERTGGAGGQWDE